MASWARGWVVLAVVGLACGPTVGLSDTGDEASGTTSVPPGTSTAMTTTGPGTTTEPPPGTTMEPPPGTTVVPDDTTMGPLEEGGFFDDGLFEVDNPSDCSLYLQDCVQGDKCMPWANDGGTSWNDTHCVPIVAEPDAVGEPCTLEGPPYSGLDTCEWGSICWDVDPATGEGTCVAFCGGSPRDPSCADPQTYCDDFELPLCKPWCDPLTQTCPDGEVCVPLSIDFECAPDGSGDMGAPGDACVFLNECDPGSFCASEMFVPGCDGLVSCCTSFCDTSDPSPPCLPGQVCMPWYEAGMEPAHHAGLGGCALP